MVVGAYYVLTSQEKGNILATKNLYECFEFFTKNKNVTLYELEYNSRCRGKVLNKQEFLKTFFELTKDKEKFFILAGHIIKGKNNLYHFFRERNRLTAYKKWKQLTDDRL